MATWEELNKFDLSRLSNEEFSAAICNEVAHDAIARRERDLIIILIRQAAESGCFRTILPKCHSDTTRWLIDLGFKIYYQGQTEISWED